jgi:hypothetical protein
MTVSLTDIECAFEPMLITDLNVLSRIVYVLSFVSVVGNGYGHHRYYDQSTGT